MLLGSIGGLCGLERVLWKKGSLYREWLLGGEGELCLHWVCCLWCLKGLLGRVGRLWLGLLCEKCWSRCWAKLPHLV